MCKKKVSRLQKLFVVFRWYCFLKSIYTAPYVLKNIMYNISIFKHSHYFDDGDGSNLADKIPEMKFVTAKNDISSEGFFVS